METSRNKVNTIDVRPENAVKRPNLTWQSGTFSIRDIFNKFETPCVVQCSHKTSDDVSMASTKFDFLQPMLLYNQQSRKKVIARTLSVDGESATATEIGDPLIIPEDYKGWFAVMGKTTKMSLSVPHYRQVATLAMSDCDEFLVGGERNVPALLRFNRHSPPETKNLYPGDVLRMGNVYVATTKTKGSRFAKAQTKETKFLFCTDQNDRELLLPFDSVGMFYILKHRTATSKMHIPIQRIEDIVVAGQLPCVVKLLFGRLPSTQCAFTGTLLLKGSYTESSAIVSSIVNLRNILIELPLSIPLMFKVAFPTVDLMENKGYADAMHLCREKAITYRRSIKVFQRLRTADIDDEAKSGPGSPTSQEGELTANAANTNNRESSSRSSAGGSYISVRTPPESVGDRRSGTLQSNDTAISGRRTIASLVEGMSRGKDETSNTKQKPAPPSQSAKPSQLDRVVGSVPAPVTRRVDDQAFRNQTRVISGLIRHPSKENTGTRQEDDEEDDDCVYEEMWTLAKGKTPPPPPPKCKKGKPVHKIKGKRPSFTISVNNTYLTVPLCGAGNAQVDAGTDKAMSLAEKIQFWNHMQTAKKGDAGAPSVPRDRKESYNFAESDVDVLKDDRSPDDARNTVYQNIDDLREVKDLPRSSLPALPPAKVVRFVTPPSEPPDFPEYPDDDIFPNLPIPDPIAPSEGIVNDSDSGIHDGDEDEMAENKEAVAQLSVNDVYLKLKELNVKHTTREFLKREMVDGRMLSLLNPDDIETAFPSLPNVERIKIGLFIKGFRPF